MTKIIKCTEYFLMENKGVKKGQQNLNQTLSKNRSETIFF